MNDHDPEASARHILELAGFSLYDNPGAERLVAEILGVGAIRSVPPSAIRGYRAELAMVRGQWGIYLSNRLTPAQASFDSLHEIGHHYLGVRQHGDTALETMCDSIAAALLLPRMAYQRALERHGRDWRQVATEFGTDCSCTVLRFGEVAGVPLALVAPDKLRVRGEARGWHEETELRRLVSRKKLPPGLSRARLADDRRRLVLLDDGR